MCCIHVFISSLSLKVVHSYKHRKVENGYPKLSLSHCVFSCGCRLTVFWLAKLWDHLSVIIVLTTMCGRVRDGLETKRKEAYFLVCAFPFFFAAALLWFLSPLSFILSPSTFSSLRQERHTQTTSQKHLLCVLTVCSQTGVPVGWDSETPASWALCEPGHGSLLIPTVDQCPCVCLCRTMCAFICVWLAELSTRFNHGCEHTHTQHLHFSNTRSIIHLPCWHSLLKCQHIHLHSFL